MADDTACEPFGTLPDGRQVEAHLLTNDCGTRVRVLTYGGIVQSLEVPAATGRPRNVVLGFPRLEDYVARSPYFGAIIGRFANRIAGGRFELDGTTVEVPVNEPPSSVHGGDRGFDKQLWEAEPVAGDGWTGIRLHHLSRHGDQGYPGGLDTVVTYRLSTDRPTLRVDYHATTDRPTVVNLTNHSYVNLTGEGSGSVLDHEVTLNARRYLPVDADLLPTGEIEDVAGTVMDFRSPHTLGERIRSGAEQLLLARGYDHTFVIDRDGLQPEALAFAARVREPGSGLTLEVWTTEPGLDVYAGNFLDGSLVGTGGTAYRQSDGLALEPEHFSNSPNVPHFPSTWLDPGQVYSSSTEYRFSSR